jgi:hypothetical protein
VIHFIAKTWFLWWMLAMVVAVRWFHMLSVGVRMERPDALPSEEEEEAYIRSWQVLRKTQVISLFDSRRAH